jgi:hypothetical protein
MGLLRTRLLYSARNIVWRTFGGRPSAELDENGIEQATSNVKDELKSPKVESRNRELQTSLFVESYNSENLIDFGFEKELVRKRLERWAASQQFDGWLALVRVFQGILEYEANRPFMRHWYKKNQTFAIPQQDRSEVFKRIKHFLEDRESLGGTYALLSERTVEILADLEVK